MESHSFISVIPTLMYTTEAIKYTEISERNCVFTWEKSLKYFANYSYDNCLTECRLDIIKKLCGCVPFIYWNINGIIACKSQTNISNIINYCRISQYNFV